MNMLTADEAAARLGLTTAELLHRAHHAEIRFSRDGVGSRGQLLFAVDDVDAYEVGLPLSAELGVAEA